GAVPAEDRESILAHWDGLSPRIKLWPSRLYCQAYPPAQTMHYGSGMRFDIDRLLGFPKEEWIVLAIAEELAHNFLFATRAPSHTLTGPKGAAESLALSQAQEADALEVIVRWGFSRVEHQVMLKWGCETNWGRQEVK